MKNPFRPSAGATPPQIIGRAGLLEEFTYGMELGAGAPGLLAIFTGARGIGKTVMLGEAHDAARQRGWAVIAETATPGFFERIGSKMRRIYEELGSGSEGRRVTGVMVAGLSVSMSAPAEQQVSWEEQGQKLLSLLAEQGTGLVVTVDEIHAADRTELSQLAAYAQHYIQADLPIALIFAGLPAAVSDLLNEGVATFLRRADKYDLHAAAIGEVEKSYVELFGQSGMKIEPGVLKRAAQSTGGYPFLIQLVGYYLWRAAEAGGGKLDAEAADKAIEAALRRHERSVIEAALASASPRDMDFLNALAQLERPAAIKDIAAAMVTSQSQASNYRTRLVASGLAEPAGYGKVDFAIPGLAQYLARTQR